MPNIPAAQKSPSAWPINPGTETIVRVEVQYKGSNPEHREFRYGSIRIGRHPSNDIVIPIGTISNYHGVFHLGPDGVVYEDLKSTNGSGVKRKGNLLRVGGSRQNITIEDADELVLGEASDAVMLRVGIIRSPIPKCVDSDGIESVVDIAESLAAVELDVLSELGQGAEKSALLALHRFSSRASGERSLRGLFVHLSDSVLETIPQAERLTVYMRDTEGDSFSAAYAQDRNGEAKPEPISRVLTEIVFGRGRAILFSITDPEFDASESLVNSDISGGLCAPLWNGEQIIGLVVVDSRSGIRPTFDVNDLKWLTLLCHQVALFVDIAQLTTGLENTVDQLTCAQAQLEQLAFFDSLTGLHNRRLFLDRLEQAVRVRRRSGQRFALLYIDIDYFKRINDALGHDAGDSLLCAVGDRLLECVRNEDSVARIGGDEFAVLLCQINEVESASVVADKILNALRRPFVIGEHSLYVTASIGVTIGPDDGESAEALCRNADLALYRAKKLGRDSFHFFVEEMNREIADRLFLQREMWTGLEQSQFVLRFQPIWRLDGSQLVGAEALVRWQHPHRGLLMPDRFIPLAEESDLINRIGEWVIHRACEYLADAHSAGRESIKISINLSARQFRGVTLIAAFKRSLDETGIPAENLEVEITETLLMENINETRVVLEQMRELGISIAIDDFGTGYCSFSYLKDLPIDVLKIDRSFVQRVESNPDDAEIVAAVIAMAHKLRLKVVAEGIESEGQLALLRANLCDLGQGYLLGRPIPFETLVAQIPMVRDHGSCP